MQGEDADLPDKALEAFMQHCSEQIGDAYFQKPSDTVTAFVNFLSTLEQILARNGLTLLRMFR